MIILNHYSAILCLNLNFSKPILVHCNILPLDIDECILGTHACRANEVCENEEGSYFCFETNIYEDETANKCPPGHSFNADKSVCDGMINNNLSYKSYNN